MKAGLPLPPLVESLAIGESPDGHPSPWRPPSLIERVMVLNCYGTLLIVAAAALLALGYLATRIAGPAAMFASPVIFSAALVAGGFGARVTARTGHRVRIFRTLLWRIRRKGLDRKFFDGFRGELCTRKVTWLVLRRLGHGDLYSSIVARPPVQQRQAIIPSSLELQRLIDDGFLDENDVRAAVFGALSRRRTIRP